MGLFSKITKSIPGLSDVVEGATAVASLVDLFSDDDVPSDVRAAGRDTRAIARALQDPTDPMFQRLAAEEESTIARDYARALRDIGTQNRRMMARTGGLGILDPERRDEALAGAFAKSYADRKQQARDQARAYLSTALTANQAVAGAYAPMIAADQRDREKTASGMQMLLDLFQERPSQTFNIDIPGGLSFSGTPRPSPEARFPNFPTTYTTPVSFR